MGVVAIFVFLMLRLSPGDPAAILAGDAATPETIAAIRAGLGLDQPIWVQFVHWIGDLAQGDLGRSVLSKQPVMRSEAHTSELQSLMRISYAVFCLKTKNTVTNLN